LDNNGTKDHNYAHSDEGWRVYLELLEEKDRLKARYRDVKKKEEEIRQVERKIRLRFRYLVDKESSFALGESEKAELDELHRMIDRMNMDRPKGKPSVFLGVALVFMLVLGVGAFWWFNRTPTQCQFTLDTRPTNVILMIGDGMGFGHVNAARLIQGRPLLMDGLAIMGGIATQAHTDSLDGTTDSAAAATALATGYRTVNGRLGMDKAGKSLRSIMASAREAGMWTGIVTTTTLSHATPAGFYANTLSREDERVIGQQLVKDMLINVAFGGGMPLSMDELGEYKVIESREEMLALSSEFDVRDPFVLGMFSPGMLAYERIRSELQQPAIWEMTESILGLLSLHTEGFMLMIEGGRIDHAAHENNIVDVVFETLAFDRAVGYAYDFAYRRGDTLLIVVADHETGGLEVSAKEPAFHSIEELKDDQTVIGRALDVSWKTSGHTSVCVPLFVYGPGSEALEGIEDINTEDLGRFLHQIVEGTQ
jgi:alkaline phosphatase